MKANTAKSSSQLQEEAGREEEHVSRKYTVAYSQYSKSKPHLNMRYKGDRRVGSSQAFHWPRGSDMMQEWEMLDMINIITQGR